MAKSALVTGASGFIGSHLVEHLQASGIKPYAMVRKTSSLRNLEESGAERRVASLDDVPALAHAMAGVDVVFHVAGLTAAYSAQQLIHVNRAGTENVIEAARRAGIQRLVLVSSLEGAGPSWHERARAEAHAVAPFTRYGRSKLAGERAAWQAVQDGLDFDVVIVRPPLVYGPRDLDVLQMIQSSNMRVVARPGFRDGWISAIHVHDLVRGLRLASERGAPLPRGAAAHVLADGGHHWSVAVDPADPVATGVYFFDDGGQHTIKSFGHDAAKALGKSALTLPVPYPVAWVAGWGNELAMRAVGKSCPAYNSDKVAASFAEGWWGDSSKARQELGYEPEMPLDEGLEQTVRWLRDNRVL